MKTTQMFNLSVELEIELIDANALKAYAESELESIDFPDAESKQETLAAIQSDHSAAILEAIDPYRIADEVPGIQVSGTTASVAAKTDAVEAPRTQDPSTRDSDFGEEMTLSEIIRSGERISGIAPTTLGYDDEETDPDARAQSLRDSVSLAGAIATAYSIFVDQLIDDVCTLRKNDAAVEQTMMISQLPSLYSASYDALFAQRFLAIVVDLGTSMTRSFAAPSCVAQELALKLLLDLVEAVEDIHPELELQVDWRGLLEDSMFEDLDHELLYSAGFDGIGSGPSVASLGMANLDVSGWFEPFSARHVNPYAQEV